MDLTNHLQAQKPLVHWSTSIQEFMSPYQQQVIDTTLEEFDRQKAMQEQRISDQAVASGAFGGGRQGVLESEFRTGSDRDEALLNAQLLQQGFGQAQALAAQRFGQQTGLAGMLPQLQRADVSTLGQLGALDRGLAQAQTDADREAARMAAFQPQEQVDRYANLVTGIMGGYPGQTQTTNIPNPTPLQNALAIASAGAGIYGALNNPGGSGFTASSLLKGYDKYRTLRRPMFRMGGSTNEGISSGLDTPKRGLVDGPGTSFHLPTMAS